jgi:hypothetical protein
MTTLTAIIYQSTAWVEGRHIMNNATIEKRMEKLEKELASSRLQIRFLLVAAVILFTITFWNPIAAIATGESNEVQASKFTLVDDNGNMRASLAMNENMPRLNFYDEKGVSLAELGLFENGPGLNFSDNKYDDTQGSIYGTTYMDGRPVAGHILVIDSKTNIVVAQVDTNINGHFYIKNLAEGDYLLKFLNMQGVPFGKDTIVEVRSGRHESIDIKLSASDRQPLGE